ncbi:MAG: pilus assembly PilX N-terminal domain-containing protein [Acidobacteria bacterium]|nr:pilus assembly PilX N-terminal domain-containing protein [Acidobacteriota bacterium]
MTRQTSPHPFRPGTNSGGGNDEGIAMVLALLFMLALSALGASVMVLSRTETLSSVNYRMLSQARYGAESGVHKAAHFLLNGYALPGSVSDPLSNYDTTLTPVRYLGQPVVLSALSDVGANYPDAASQTAFANAAGGTLTAGSATVVYTASATLLSMQEIIPYGSSTPTVVQTWRITARGSIQGAREAEVEVSALLERQVVAPHTYAAFATGGGCGALSFEGGVHTDSYDSTNMTMVDGAPSTDTTWGNVGTNGNLTEAGNSVVSGSLSTPRSGVGGCSDGAVTALTQQGNAQVSEGLVALPQAVSYPAPDAPSPLPPTTSTSVVSTSACAVFTLSSGICTGGSGALTLDPQGSPMPLDNVHVTGGATLTLEAGTYNINSLTLTGGATIVIGSGPVILEVAGQSDDTPIDFEGGATANDSFDPSMFRIHYAGAGTLKLTGGTTTAAIVYAPSANATITGGADFYGSVLAASVSASGGAGIHYDRSLASNFFTTGPQMMSSFSWKKQ